MLARGALSTARRLLHSRSAPTSQSIVPWRLPIRRFNALNDGPRPQKGDADQVERWKYLAGVKPRPDRLSDNVVPVEKRDEHNYFRKGFSIPQRGAPTIWKMIVQPIYDVIAFSQVSWDTTTRYTRLGFTLLHVAGMVVFLTLGAQLGEYSFMEVTDQFHVAYDEYMFHMAQLIWVRRAIKNCEAVIDSRPGGVPRGPLLEEAVQMEQDKHKFIGAEIPIQKRILERSLFLREQEIRQQELEGLTQEQKRQFEQMMGEYKTNVIQSIQENKPLKQAVPTKQRGDKPVIDSFKTAGLQQKHRDVQMALQEQNAVDFKQKYIYSQITKTGS